MANNDKWYCSIEVSFDETSKIAAGHMASSFMTHSRLFESEERAQAYFDFMRKAIDEASRKFDEIK